MKGFTNKLLYIFTTLIFILAIYNISITLIDFGMISLGRQFFLIVISLFLFIPYFKNNKKRNEIIKSGLLLEQKVQNELEKLSIEKYKIISNVIIKNNRDKQEFDNIILSNKGIYILKCINFTGDIVINENGAFKKYYKNKYYYIENPCNELNEEITILYDILGDIDIKPIFVIKDKFITITGKKNSKFTILTVNEVKDYITNDLAVEKYNKDGIYNIVKNNINGYSNIFSLRCKYDEFGWYTFEYKTKISISSIFIMWYILNLI